MTATDGETLVFDDLEPHLLLKNGNFLYKVPFRDGFAVLKVYYGSRGVIGRLYKSLANVVLYGQTSYMAKTRLRIERECLALWAAKGFRTFGVYEDVIVKAPQCPEDGYLLLEYVDEPKLHDYMADASVSADERFALYRRWLQEWGRRHRICVDEREPRLIHENGDGKHVMLLDDGSFLWFDFEMVYRSDRHLPVLVGHEINQYLWQMLRRLTPDEQERMLAETVAHYPYPELLEEAWRHFLRPRNPLMRFPRWLERTFRKRAKKPTSKHNVARRLKAALEAGTSE